MMMKVRVLFDVVNIPDYTFSLLGAPVKFADFASFPVTCRTSAVKRAFWRGLFSASRTSPIPILRTGGTFNLKASEVRFIRHDVEMFI
jgi:hypothetical protein